MKKQFFFAAVALVALASCSSEEIIGDSPTPNPEKASDAIVFSSGTKAVTRGDITGPEAAKKLNNFFYVMGTKADVTATPMIPTASPTTIPVFDNYFVQYTANTAGTTQSNTANWEYVGKNPGTSPTGYPKLSSITGAQTIKYWDYSAPQYDFFAFSTGSKTPVNGTPTSGQVGVTSMNYGASLASGGTAYTFSILDEASLKEVYITDITEVLKANYGKEVQLRFKNLGSKIRIALYETIPGYSVSDVKFYTADAADVPTDLSSATKVTDATLISTSSIPTSGTIVVSFPHVGSTSKAVPDADYNQASVNVTAGSSTVTSHGFGALTANYTTKENAEADGKYLGRTLPTATFAGSKADDYYTTVFPVNSSSALTLRVDYTLTATDGSGETIKIYGAKASVPANYTVWRPNYAYTYIFKISDATNGWTTTTATADNEGLYPITFDAMVAAVTDATAEQTTITTVETPSVTTYQQGHTYKTNEYSKTGSKDIYVQVMNTAVEPAVLYNDLTDDVNSFVYELSDANATEAKVLDALTMRKDAYDLAGDVNGRNGLTLNLVDVIDNTVDEIENGVDDQSIDITAGEAGKIDISALTANKSYAYVYIQTAQDEEVNKFEPVAVTVDSKINSSETSHVYYKLTVAEVEAGTTLTAAEAPADGYVYFSVVTDGNGAKTYYYISTLGKASVPKGCIKVAENTDADHKVTGNDNAVANTFYFDKYILNNGKYAVKVIKVV